MNFKFAQFLKAHKTTSRAYRLHNLYSAKSHVASLRQDFNPRIVLRAKQEANHWSIGFFLVLLKAFHLYYSSQKIHVITGFSDQYQQFLFPSGVIGIRLNLRESEF
jgi:hypothetical protein